MVVAPVPFVTTHATWLADGVTLLTDGADPVVEPDIAQRTLVEAPAIEVLPIVKVRSAAAAIETPVNVTDPVRPLQFTVPDAAPLAVVTGRETPVPAATATKFPFVAVILPEVAVRLVPAVMLVVAPNAPA